MEAVLNPTFPIGYEKTRENIYLELRSRIDTVTLNAIKGYLREKGIEFDARSINLNEFKNTVVPTLDKRTQIDVANIEQGLNEKLSGLIKELKGGSTTAFQKFANGFGSFAKSTVEMAACMTAVKTAYALSPTAGGVALGASILIPPAVRLVKDLKQDIKNNTRSCFRCTIIKIRHYCKGWTACI